MKKILIIHYSMEIGGAESSLLGMLQSIDYSSYEVDLMLLRQEGELMAFLPTQVRLIPVPKEYRHLAMRILDVVKEGGIGIATARTLGKILGHRYKGPTYAIKQYSHRLAMPFLPAIQPHYDLALSFIDPHYVIGQKVSADVKIAWLHTDYSQIACSWRMDERMWDMSNFIVSVSDSCKLSFDTVHPQLSQKSIVIENILSPDFIQYQSDRFDCTAEMCGEGALRVLSIGRFCEAKNFDNVPDICRRVLEKGIPIKWYLIGYGGDELLIRKKIAEAGMEDHVIILGKKENPYPYIKACDLYVQPSRYEGKCVSVREAQMLHKPVIITDYETSSSQLLDGYDGVIVPMDNQGCAEEIARVILDSDLREKLVENTKRNDYSNAKEIEKLYRLIYDED